MLAVVNSCSLMGLESYPVQVEVDVSSGLPAFDIVGLPDTSIRESKERVRAAIKNSGFQFPPKRVTVNLAPADIRKEGPIFDLPIAVGILVATGQIVGDKLGSLCILGELSLSGELRRIPGVLAMTSGLKNTSIECFIVPEGNGQEAALLSDYKVFGLESLLEVCEFLCEDKVFPSVQRELPEFTVKNNNTVYSDIIGQANAKRALEIAAAGGHNIILLGPPGSGKTMLARALNDIMPEMSLNEALEVSKIYSVSGLLSREKPLILERPFRAPHHNASLASMVGGGVMPKPGEISLATNGVLFLDELTEYPKKILESLRQPLEDRVILVSRNAAAVHFPVKCCLVAAMNPCPCGFLGDTIKECSCSPNQIKKYLSRISGPLLDRFDLQVQVPRVKQEDILRGIKKDSIDESIAARERVYNARKRQKLQFIKDSISCNSEMNNRQIKKYCKLTQEASEFYKIVYEKYGFTMRSYTRILKVAKTVADLEGKDQIQVSHLAEAIQYRDYDRLMKDCQLF
ncbi:MAG: YifB family Mg chelatase-like AAA ATPase [Bacillota bacterium]